MSAQSGSEVLGYRFISPIAIYQHTPKQAANLLRAIANTIETQVGESSEQISGLRVTWVETDGGSVPFSLEEVTK